MRRLALLLGLLACPAAAQDAPLTMTNSLGMEFLRVDAGTMQVAVFQPACPTPGDGGGLAGSWSAEDLALCERMVSGQSSPGFPVTIAQGFYLGRYEVTQGQWQALMQANPATFHDSADWADHPVESITWDQAQAFVAALNAAEHTDAYYLPGEFEWEYACRAGGPGQQDWDTVRAQAVDGGASLGFGFGLTPRDANLPPPTTAPVGSKAPNAWGFYDMLGNVWEWTADGYNHRLFPDPQPSADTTDHVLKGGGFVADVKNAICATRGGPPGNGWDIGLRVARRWPSIEADVSTAVELPANGRS